MSSGRARSSGQSRAPRQLAERRVAEERREPVAEDAVGDDLVAVTVRPERRLRVVHMEEPEPLEPDALVELVEGFL